MKLKQIKLYFIYNFCVGFHLYFLFFKFIEYFLSLLNISKVNFLIDIRKNVLKQKKLELLPPEEIVFLEVLISDNFSMLR